MKKDTTANRLKEIMTTRNLRQVDILERCKPYCQQYDVKLGRNDLSQYVNGKVEPRQDKLTILAHALNVDEAWLMGFDVPRDFNKAWDQAAERFEAERLAFHYQLESLGWTGKWDTNDKYYLLTNGNISFKISSNEYSNLIDASQNFLKEKLQLLYEEAAIDLFLPRQEPLLNAAHQRTDINIPEDIDTSDDEIMDDEDF